MKAPHLETGENGENLAAAFLLQKGYEVLSRNYRYKKAEVDIIARIGNDLVFIEVKTRKNADFGFPEEMVSANKQRLMILAMEAFQKLNKLEKLEPRFDIIAIIGNFEQYQIEHIEDAFFPDWGTATGHWEGV